MSLTSDFSRVRKVAHPVFRMVKILSDDGLDNSEEFYFRLKPYMLPKKLQKKYKTTEITIMEAVLYNGNKAPSEVIYHWEEYYAGEEVLVKMPSSWIHRVPMNDVIVSNAKYRS